MTPRQKAKANGDDTYVTGRPCKNGHVAARYVSDRGCVRCALSRAEKRYAENTEKLKAYSKDRYHKNPEPFKERRRDIRSFYADSQREAGRKEYSRNKDKYLARMPAICARRRAAKRQRVPEWLTTEQHQQIKDLYSEAKRLKNLTGIGFHVDHIVPLQGQNVSGLHVPWNLRIITAHENLSKNNRLIEEAATCQQQAVVLNR